MSIKNKLQEYFQKLKGTLPSYNTKRIDGPDHKPLWKSKVTISINHTLKSFEGEISERKTQAEINSAQKALDWLQNQTKKEKIMSTYDIAVIIDIENKPNALKELFQNNTYSSNIDFYIFASKSHPSITKNMDLINEYKVQLKEINSTRKNAADIGICIFVGTLGLTNYYRNVLILSGDGFADTLSEIATHQNTSIGPKVFSFRDISTLIKNID